MRYMTYSFVFKPKEAIDFALNFMCLNASKLWNIGNYERKEYEKLGYDKMPDWFDQKKRLKVDEHYKCLMSQSAMDVLKDLDCAWKSYKAVKKKNKNAQPPYYKKKGRHTCIKFSYHSIKIVEHNILRLSIPAKLRFILQEKFGHEIKFIYIKLKESLPNVKVVSFTHTASGVYKVCINYEKPQPPFKEDNGRHIGIDLGIKNLFAVYDNNGSSFIIDGSSFKNTIYYFSKKIAHYQKVLRASYEKSDKSKAFFSKRIGQLYKTKKGRLNYLIHATTRKIVDYCLENDITIVIIGDMKYIKNNCDFGKVSKQQFYSLAFMRIIETLNYKLNNEGIKLIRVDEAYSSQCAPMTLRVDKAYSNKNCRKKRGLYKINNQIFNADCLGAFNILRIYYQHIKKDVRMDYSSISNPSSVCIPVTLGFFDYFPCWTPPVGVAGRDCPSSEQFMAILYSHLCPPEA